jgi:hypothetical protein
VGDVDSGTRFWDEQVRRKYNGDLQGSGGFKNERFRNMRGFDFHFSERIKKGEGCVLRYSKTNYPNSSKDAHNDSSSAARRKERSD